MEKIINRIKKENDIKNICPDDYARLMEEIRELLIDVVTDTGGHLASNLGIVELTAALHLNLTFPEDKLIFDVGHQSYVHKILTGRKDSFQRIRSLGGISGFPKRKESLSDAFGTGHSSTALSAAIGYAEGRKLLLQDCRIAAVIGDGAATGGLFYEAFNNLASVSGNIVIILNDNGMSISPNIGAVAGYLRGGTAGGAMKAFLDGCNVDYMGPFNGHDLYTLIPAVEKAFRNKRPVLLHVKTRKGKGYLPAEENPAFYHGIGGRKQEKKREESYTDVFGRTMTEIAGMDNRVAAITAAMEDGVGLSRYHAAFPDRFYDVGIAEGHAVTFAAGMAAAGLKPYVAVYSSFLQRAFDQIIHDVCLQCLPVVFCIDRAGIVGEDGETHQGIFDISYLSMIPGMTVAAPGDKKDMEELLKWSLKFSGPLAVRYPKGPAYVLPKEEREAIRPGRCETVIRGENIALLAAGGALKAAVGIYHILLGRGYHVSLINVRFIKPFDKEILYELTENHKLLVTLEENVLTGGYGQQVSHFLSSGGSNAHVLNIGIEDAFIRHGTVEEIKRELHLDEAALAERIMEEYRCCEKKEERIWRLQ